MKRVVITGPTGALGIALINALINKNIQVLAICRPNSKNKGAISKHPLVEIIECDISHFCDLINKSHNSYDTFFHFAWEGSFGEGRNDTYLQNRNIRNTLDAVKLAQSLGCKTFIGAGSQAEYGRVNGILKPELQVDPESGYGIAKYSAGKLSALYAKQLGIRHIWTRILSIYGPHDDENTMIMYAIRELLNKKVPRFTKGEQLWDYLYSEDAANAFCLIAEHGNDGSIYCLGSSVAHPLCDYIYSIRNIIDPSLEVGVGQINYVQGQVMYLCADISNLTKDTGFVPQVNFTEGITKTIEWYRRSCAI